MPLFTSTLKLGPEVVKKEKREEVVGCWDDFLIKKQIVNSDSKIAKLKASMFNGAIIFNRAREGKGTDLGGAPTLHWVLPDLPGVIPKHGARSNSLSTARCGPNLNTSWIWKDGAELKERTCLAS